MSLHTKVKLQDRNLGTIWTDLNSMQTCAKIEVLTADLDELVHSLAPISFTGDYKGFLR